MSTALRTVLALAVLAASAPTLAGTGASNDPSRFVVGFEDTPPVEPGDVFEGGIVLRVDASLRFAVVLAGEEFPTRAALDPRVRYVEPDALLHLLRFAPNDPRYGQQYGPQQIQAPAAWDTTLGAASVVLCIVDSGVRRTHEDLAARYAGGYDFANGDADPSDDNGHGTHVAGIAVGATHNGKGIAGIAQVAHKHVKSIRYDGRAAVSDVASGFAWCADNGAHVMSLSIGTPDSFTSWEDGINYAWAKGTLPVAAAGNGPTGSTGGCANCVEHPARYANAMAVGCTTSSKATCTFQSQGPEVEVAAPGLYVVSAWRGTDSDYREASGTSMSTPHVAGAAALVKTVEPGLTNAEIRARLTATAEDLGPAGRDPAYGFGLVRADRAIGNVAPAVTGFACAPAPSAAGRTVECALVATDTPGQRVFFTVHWGDGSPPERVPATGTVPAGTPATARHRFDAVGTYVATATATDDHLASLTSPPATREQAVVANAAPSAPQVACAPNPGGKGAPVTCTFLAADDSDGVAFLVEWGDGSAVERIPAAGFLTPGVAHARAHTWTEAGDYTILATAVDDGLPPRTGPTSASPLAISACDFTGVGWIHAPGVFLLVEGVTMYKMDVPASCVGLPFALTDETGLNDFDVCWHAGATRLRCDQTPASEGGHVPAGATEARVFLAAGAGGEFRLRVPSADPPIPGTILLVADDDGEMDATFLLDGPGDVAEKTLIVPGDAWRASHFPTLHVYARARDCAPGAFTHVLVFDGVPLLPVDPCGKWTETGFTWATFALPPDALTPGPHRFRIEDTGSTATRNLELGMDRDSSLGRTVARNGAAHPGELMWRLTFVRA